MKPPVFVTRHLPAAAWNMLSEFCQPESWNSESVAPYATIREKTADKEGLLCLLSDKIDADLIAAAPQLRVISQCAVGFDNVDVAAASARNIAVGNTPGVLTETTADFAFALLMAAARRVVEGMDYIRAGRWQSWGLTVLLGQDIHHATLGLVGLGRIGAAVARRAAGFDMRLLYTDRERQPELEASLNIEYVPLDQLLAQSDFISLHVPLTPETHHLIGAAELATVKPSAILINTARGPIIDTDALVAALQSGQLAAAALDVTDPEPIAPEHPLLTLPNVIVAPHIASASAATRQRMAIMAVENLAAGLAGRPLPYPVN